MYYIICSCPRSGSTLLAEALLAMGAGRPEEYLSVDIFHGRVSSMERREGFMQPTPLDYIERIKQENTVNGIFGLKTHDLHLAAQPEILTRMKELFPNAKYIATTRRNSLRQAISAARATQTHAWTAQLPQRKRPFLNYWSIIKLLFVIAQEIELWEVFYAEQGIKPLRILYEDLELDYEQTMWQVVSFLGLTGDIPPPSMHKQADSTTEDWVKRSSRLFRGTGWLSRAARFIAQRL